MENDFDKQAYMLISFVRYLNKECKTSLKFISKRHIYETSNCLVTSKL